MSSKATGHKPLVGRPCSIAMALRVIGEKWALLAVREITFGNHRFDQIARNTAAPRDVLTARLRHLEEAGIIRRRAYSAHPPRFEYHLTPAGEDLAPVLHALRTWADSWLVKDPPVVAEHDCGHVLQTVTTCRHCGREATPETVRLIVGSPGWTVQGPAPQSQAGPGGRGRS